MFAYCYRPMARLCYQMIQHSTMSFEKFKTMLFPEDFIEEQGVLVVGDMLNLANTGKIDRSMQGLMDQVTEEMISELATTPPVATS